MATCAAAAGVALAEAGFAAASGGDCAASAGAASAGVAAVDLYENKLDRFDKALEILLALHAAKLSSLPVRERLARAAGQAILERQQRLLERVERDGGRGRGERERVG